MKVPFLDLPARHRKLRNELREAFDEVLESGEFAGGSFVDRFEQEFAEFCGVSHAVGVASGTDALWLGLMAAGVGPGDEVITVPMTFVATVEAILRTGATPKFVDVLDSDCTMDPDALASAIGPRTAAIVPVHLFGRLAQMSEILQIAERHGLPVIEDAAQAHGAEDSGRRAGGFHFAAGFSFYPGKNLGALGDAGAVTTRDAESAERIRRIRNHGQRRKYEHAEVGWNCRMDGIQAAVLSRKLRHLERDNQRRRVIAGWYETCLSDLPDLRLVTQPCGSAHVHHLQVIRVPERERLLAGMKEQGIECGIHYPVPVHLQEAYAFLGVPAGSFPVAEQCAREVMSLPMYPELSRAQTEAVGEALRGVLLEPVSH